MRSVPRFSSAAPHRSVRVWDPSRELGSCTISSIWEMQSQASFFKLWPISNLLFFFFCSSSSSLPSLQFRNQVCLFARFALVTISVLSLCFNLEKKKGGVLRSRMQQKRMAHPHLHLQRDTIVLLFYCISDAQKEAPHSRAALSWSCHHTLFTGPLPPSRYFQN